jgi:hypothetical protein
VRVRVKPVAGGLPTTDTARFELPKTPAAGVLLLGQPVYARRGTAASAAVVATADLRFRRTERIVVDTSATLKPGGVEAELLDRGGKPIAVTVAVTTSEKDQVTWVRSELALAPLAAGDYVIRITAIRGNERAVVLAAFRVVN